MLDEHAELANTGIFGINLPDAGNTTQVEKTLIVLGAPRGGTSALAGAIHSMGVYMGRGASAPVYESLALSKAIERNEQTTARKLVAEFNREHAVWAFKRPGFYRFVSQFHEVFRNPIYLVIFRDPVATANRSYISGRLKVNYTKKLRRALTVYGEIIDFVESTSAQTLFVSYEKLLNDPAATLNAIANYLGLQVSPERLAAAADFVEPSPQHYLEVSRSHRVSGEWLIFDQDRAAGWAEYVNKTMTIPPKITLYEGERALVTVKANLPSVEGVATASAERPCGFQIDLSGTKIHDRTALRLRVVGEIRDFARPDS